MTFYFCIPVPYNEKKELSQVRKGGGEEIPLIQGKE